MEVVKDKRAIDSLQRLYDFAWKEEEFALAQAKAMKEVKDFRAFDRHASYAIAMLKMQHQIRAHASNVFGHDVHSGRESVK